MKIFITEWYWRDKTFGGPKIIAPTIAIAEDLLIDDIQQGLSPPNAIIIGRLLEEIDD